MFRAGWASTRPQARQFVSHGHVDVNGKRVDIPSYRVRKGDVISLRDKARSMIVIRHNLDTLDAIVPAVARDRRRRLQRHRRRPAPPRPDRRARARAAHRRALLQVIRPDRTPKEETPCWSFSDPPSRPSASAEGNRQRFAISPLEPGFGHTLGNSLRRTLLSSIPGAAVTQVRFDDALHEFDTINGVTEDVTDIILNLKDLVLTSTVDEPVTLRLDVRGPADVTAADIQTTSDVEILNTDLHIATLNSKGRLALDITVERGRGYVSADRNKESTTIGIIPVDSIFSPVRRVTFDIEPTRVEMDTNFDRLVLDIETDGSITPARGARLRRRHAPLAGRAGRRDERRARRASSSARSATVGAGSPDLDLPIEDLDLSERPRNCLKRAQVNTVGELLQQERGRPAGHHQLRPEVARRGHRQARRAGPVAPRDGVSDRCRPPHAGAAASAATPRTSG